MDTSDHSEQVRKKAEQYIDSCGEYTSAFERNKLIENWVEKEKKADGMVADFRRRAGEPRGARVLEVGFGSGFYMLAFAKAGASVYGVEVNDKLREIAVENFRERGVPADLQTYNGTQFPYEDNYFDYVYMVSVLEHVSDPYAVVREVERVLKPGGKFYVSFPNRLAPRETHSGVWLISYVPLPVAEWIYVHLLHRNTVQELNLHFLSFWSLKRFIRGTRLSIIFETGGGSALKRVLKNALARCGVHHSAILRTVMVVLEKGESY